MEWKGCRHLVGIKYHLILRVYDPFVASLFSPQGLADRRLMYLLINALTFFAFLYLLFVFRDRKRRKGLPYPPGPPLRPMIGNLLDIPTDEPWTVYADMSKKYGRRYILGNATVVFRS